MTDVKISQLPVASLPLTGAEIFPLVQNGTTVQATLSDASKGITANSDSFTGDGVQVNFNLTSTPGSANLLNVYINGVYQNKNAYSLSSVTIAFSEAPPYNSIIEAVYL